MRWTLLLLLAIGGSACLVDQNVGLEPDPVEPGNRAPRILGRDPELGTIHTQRACRRTFQLLGVEDSDGDDDLELRWFVNYEPDAPQILLAGTISGGQGAMRTVPGDLRLSLAFDEFREEVLVVEAVVSDGFDPDPAQLPANRAVLPGHAAATTSWTVIVADEDWCDN